MRIAVLVISMAFFAPAVLQAEESGFLSDYEGMRFAAGEYGGKAVPVPGVTDKMAGITKIMVDQPEIFIADDSEYKGMKPRDAQALSETLRQAILSHVDDQNKVEEAGADVLYLRMAISGLHLKKKQRKLISYTPPGIIANTAKKAIRSDVMKKIDLIGVTIEAESFNSATREHLGSLVIKLAPLGGGSTDEASWDNLLSTLDSLSAQIVCRIRNSKLKKADREDCKILESYIEG